MSTANNTVVIAGGTSGIGLATAKRLAANGTKVIITGRSKEKMETALAGAHANITGVVMDSASRSSMDAGFAQIGQFNHLVIAVSGAKGGGAFKELDITTVAAGMQEKLVPHLQTAQAALPYLATTGSITFVGAVSSHSRGTGIAGLAAINGAIESTVPGLAKELQPLRVNAVSPGVVNTAWWNFLAPDARQQTFAHFASVTPAGRIGEPDELAQVIELLVNNCFITGQVITVDGGYSL